MREQLAVLDDEVDDEAEEDEKDYHDHGDYVTVLHYYFCRCKGWWIEEEMGGGGVRVCYIYRCLHTWVEKAVTWLVELAAAREKNGRGWDWRLERHVREHIRSGVGDWPPRRDFLRLARTSRRYGPSRGMAYARYFASLTSGITRS